MLEGMAVFLDDAPTALAYVVRCDGSWRTTDAEIRGWRGADRIELQVRRADTGEWRMNGATCPEVSGCAELDLNFTPATNLLPLRRLALQPGEAGEVRSAWLEWPEPRLRALVQRYARRGPSAYDYEAELPDGTTFHAELRVDPDGWVIRYGELWAAEGTP